MENTAITKTEDKPSFVPMKFDEAQIELVKKTVAKGTTTDELALFLYTCKKTGLDPLIRQIYAVKRNTKNGPIMTIQTGIDGYRLIAERTGNYAPGREPSFTEENGKLISATAYVKKLVGGIWHEVAATARFSEYVNSDNWLWGRMPYAMLAKCAEALALRRSFPAEMGGVYTHEEMSQAADTVDVEIKDVKEELTRDGLQALADRKKAELHTEDPKTPPAKAQATPVSDKTAEPEIKSATGQVIFHNLPKGASKYHSFCLHGYKGVYFQTADSSLIETLDGMVEAGEDATLEYSETSWEKNGKTGLNRHITGLIVHKAAEVTE